MHRLSGSIIWLLAFTGIKAFGGSDWASGYSINAASGHQTEGTSMRFGICHDVSAGVCVGMTTLASGGESERLSYMRLSAGPSVRFGESWYGGVALLYAKEKGASTQDDSSYRRKAGGALFMWGKAVRLSKTARLTVGGYGSALMGGYENTGASSFSMVSSPRSFERGFSVGIYWNGL